MEFDGRRRSTSLGPYDPRTEVGELLWPERFDAAVMLYSIIHVPVAEHRSLLERVCTWLRPGGLLVLTAGVDEWTGGEDGWFGTEATMWWSQADAASYRRWLTGSGFVIDDEAIVPDGESAHTLFWAHRR